MLQSRTADIAEGHAIAKPSRGSLGKKPTLAGSNRCGKAAVNMTKLPAARRKLGKEGGCKFSGNGSSQKLVRTKVSKMLRYMAMCIHSTWPSRRLAAEKENFVTAAQSVFFLHSGVTY